MEKTELNIYSFIVSCSQKKICNWIFKLYNVAARSCKSLNMKNESLHPNKVVKWTVCIKVKVKKVVVL